MPPLRARLTTGRLLLWCALVAPCVLAGCTKGEAEWAADLASPDPYVRGLASIGWAVQSPRTAAPALDTLLETIDRSEVGLERAAAAALQVAGPHHVEALLAALTGEAFLTEDRRGAILNALVTAGAPAAPAIVRCAEGPGREHAGELGEVLRRIGPPGAQPGQR